MRACTLFLLLASAPLLGADEPKKGEGPTHQVPYRLTDTRHVLVRAKINGKGPFNFILDTGAPALYVATAVCKKLGIEADEKGWGTFPRFEVEGGVVIEKARGRVADPFQIDGMNKLGLAGVELHGVIGYNVLARYRIGFDFSKDKMPWTKLDFEPPLPEVAGNKGANVDTLGAVVKAMAGVLGKQVARETRLRGFLGAELADKEDGVVIAAVLPDSPASTARLKVGDRIAKVGERIVQTVADVHKQLAPRAADEDVELVILRGGERMPVKVRLGGGL